MANASVLPLRPRVQRQLRRPGPGGRAPLVPLRRARRHPLFLRRVVSA